MAIENQLRTLEVTADVFITIFSKGVGSPDKHEWFEVEENPLPEDTVVVDAQFDASRRIFLLKLQSAEFDVVPDGAPIPEHPTIYVIHHRKPED